MANVVTFDEAATPQRVNGVFTSVHTPDFSSRTDAVINPDLSLLEGIVPRRYWKHDAGSIVEYTQAEKDAQDAQEDVEQDLSGRQGAKQALQGFGGGAMLIRALADIIKDELNILRALHALPDRTLTQLRNAINQRIDSGDVDS